MVNEPEVWLPPDAPHHTLRCLLHLHLSSHPNLFLPPGTFNPSPPCTLHQLPFLPHPSLISIPSTYHTSSSISSTQFLLPLASSLTPCSLFFVSFSIPNLISLLTLSGSQPNLLPDSYSNPLLPFLSFTPSPSPHFPIPMPKTPPIPVRGFCSSDGGEGTLPSEATGRCTPGAELPLSLGQV